MLKLSKKESEVINFLVRNFAEKFTMRNLARYLNLSSGGIFKILKKLEKEKILKSKKIGNGLFYSVDFNNRTAERLAEFILSQKDLNPYAAIYAKDLESLKPYIKACALHGSILKKGKKAYDIDVIIVIDKRNFEIVEKKLSELSRLRPKRIHPIYQTEKDLAQNIREKNPALLDALKNCAVLWGEQVIVRGVKNGTS